MRIYEKSKIEQDTKFSKKRLDIVTLKLYSNTKEKKEKEISCIK